MRQWGMVVLFVFSMIIFGSLPNLSTVHGQDRGMIEAGKKASALVELPNESGYATAFCINPMGIFVTNRHVVENLKVGESITLIIEPSLSSERMVESSLERVDSENDLAILRTVQPGNFAFLKVATSRDLYETQALTAFGYPFGVSLTIQQGSYPSISINSGRVTSLRRDKGEIQLVQLDAVLNPGNSGGPIINEAGEVVGITSFGMRNAGVNFAVPSDQLRKLLYEPMVQINVPDIASKPTQFPHVVDALVSSFEEEIADPTVELSIERGKSSPVVVPMTSKGNNRYEALLDSKALGDDFARWISGRIDFDSGRMEALIFNDTIETKEGKIALSEISSIQMKSAENQDTALVVMRNGQTRIANKSSLPKVKVDFGNYPANVNLARATSMQLEELRVEDLRYTVIVKSQGKEVLRKRDDQLERIQTAAANLLLESEYANIDKEGPSSAIPKRQDARVLRPKGTLKLSNEISNLQIAGGGELLVVCHAQAKSLSVFNLNRCELQGEIQLKSDKCLVATTKKHIIAIDPNTRMIERFSVDTLKRESLSKSSVDGKIIAAAAGYGSEGPLMLCVENEIGGKSNVSLVAIDLKNFRQIKMDIVGKERFMFANARGPLELRSSFDGKTFGLWSPTDSPKGAQSVILRGDRMHIGYKAVSPGFVIPSADGANICMGRLGSVPADLASDNTQNSTSRFRIPSTHPRIALVLEGTQKGMGLEDVIVRLGCLGNNESIIDLPRVSMPSFGLGPGDYRPNELPMDKRLFYNVEKSLIVSIPASNDRLTWQSLNLRTEIKSQNANCFFVTSSPIRFFLPGRTYSYPIQVETSSSRVNYRLISGPEEMKISPDGVLQWVAPRTGTLSKVDVSISITNDSGKEIVESFSLHRLEQ